MFVSKLFKRARRNSSKSNRKWNRAISDRSRTLRLEPLEERSLLSATIAHLTLQSTAITYGQADTMRLIVNNTGMAISGNVQFYTEAGKFGPAIPVSGYQVATATLVEAGSASAPKLTAGSHQVYATFTSGNPLFVPSQTSGATGVSVAKATLTINAPTGQSMVYGSTPPIYTYANCTETGWAIGDSSGTYTLTSNPGVTVSATKSSPVGNNYVAVAYGGSDLNYNFSYPPSAFAVTPATLTITANPTTMVYGTPSLPTPTYTVTGYLNSDTLASVFTAAPQDTIQALASSHVGLGPNADGSYPITFTNFGTLVAHPNYTPQFVDGEFSITAATSLQFTADYQSRLYGDPNPTLTYHVSGFVNGDTPAIITTPPTLTTTATQSSDVAAYPIQFSNPAVLSYPNDYVNYPSSNYTDGTLVVNPASLTVTAESLAATYGTQDPFAAVPGEWGVTYSGWKGSDNTANTNVPVTLPVNQLIANSTGTTTDRKGNPIDLTGWAATPPTYFPPVDQQTGLPQNYSVSVSAPVAGWPTHITTDYIVSLSPLPATLTINPLELDIAVDPQTMTYGDDPSGLSITYTTSNPIAPDTWSDVIPGGLTSGLAVTNVIHPIIPGGGTLTNQTDAGLYQIGPNQILSADPDYTVNPIPNWLTVSPRGLTITPQNNLSFTYGQIQIISAADRIYALPDSDQVLSEISYSGLAPNGDTLNLFTSSTGGNPGPGGVPSLLTSDYQVGPTGQVAISVSDGGVQITSPGNPQNHVSDYIITCAPAVATIGPAPLNVTLNSQTLTYGQVDPNTYALQPTWALNDTVNTYWAKQLSVPAYPNAGGWAYATDNFDSLPELPQLTTTQTDVGTGLSITAGGDLSLDYDYNISFTNNGASLLTIDKAPLVITPAAAGTNNVTIETTYGSSAVGTYLPGIVGYAPGQQWYTTAVETLTGLNAPSAAAFDLTSGMIGTSGNLYVINGDGTVSEFHPGSIAADAILTGPLDVNGNPAPLNNPVALAVDGAGNLVVANGDGTLCVFSQASLAAGNTIPDISYDLHAAGVSMPSAVAFDTAGNLYVADSVGDQIAVFGPGETWRNTLTLPTGSTPASLTFDSHGNLYVADEGSGTVSVFNQANLGAAGGTPDLTLGLPPAASPLTTPVPVSVAVDAAGNVYVADQANHLVYEFAPGSTTPDANLTRNIATGISPTPTALVVDPAGNLYVANQGNLEVDAFAPGSTTASATYGSYGPNGPAALVLDQSGNLFVAVKGGTQVLGYTHPTTQLQYGQTLDSLGIFGQPSGSLQWYAMSGSTPGALVNTYSSTGSSPTAEAFDPSVGHPTSGDLFVANSGNDTVSVFAPGNTTAIATLNLPAGSYASALAFDGSGDLYVADLFLGTVSEFLSTNLTNGATPNYTLDVVEPGGTPGTPNGMPIALKFDGAGNLYVADYTGGVSVFKLTSLGTDALAPDLTLGFGGLSGPQALAFDGSGNLYVANSSANTVSIFLSSSLAPALATDTDVPTPDFTLNTGTTPVKLAFDGGGNLYVADNGDSSLSEFYGSSLTTLLAGTPGVTPPIPADQTITTHISTPSGLFYNGGKLYVSNSGDNSISRFTTGTDGYAGTFDYNFPAGSNIPNQLVLQGGDLYVVESSADAVLEFNPNGTASQSQPKDAGVYKIYADGVPDLATLQALPALANYQVSVGTATLVINKATLTLTAPSSEVTYDNTDHTPAAGTYSVDGLQYSDAINSLPDNQATPVNLDLSGLTLSAFLTDNDTNPLDAVPALHAGTYVINFDNPQPGSSTNPGALPDTAALGADVLANYNVDYVSGILTIDPATLTITAQNQGAPGDAGNPAGVTQYVYGVNNPDLTPSALNNDVDVSGWVDSSPFPYGFSLTTNDQINSLTSDYHAGTYDINFASHPSFGGDYNVVYNEPATLTINQAALVVAPNALSGTYGFLSPSNLAATVAANGAVDGWHAVSGLVLNDSLDTLYVNNVTQGIVGSTAPSPLAAQTDATVNVNSGMYDANPVGTPWDLSATTASQTANSQTEDYTITYNVSDLTIGKKSLTVNALPQGWQYGSQPLNPAGDPNHFLVPTSDPPFPATPVQPNPTIVAQTGAGVAGDLELGDTLQNIGVTGVLQDLQTDDTQNTSGGQYHSDSYGGHSGPYQINFNPSDVASPPTTTDYTVTLVNNGTGLTITPAGTTGPGLVLSPASQSFTYGSQNMATAPSAATVSATGLAPGDTLSSLNYTYVAPLTSTDTLSISGWDHAGTYDLNTLAMQTGHSASEIDPDYVISFAGNPNGLVIAQANATVQAGNAVTYQYPYGGATWGYDGTNTYDNTGGAYAWPTLAAQGKPGAGFVMPAVGYTGDTFSSEGVSPTVATTATAQSHVLLDASGNPKGYAITVNGPSQSQDYKFTYQTGQSLTIEPAGAPSHPQLIFQAQPQSVVYGQTLPTYTYTEYGWVNNDTPAALGSHQPLLAMEPASKAIYFSQAAVDPDYFGLNLLPAVGLQTLPGSNYVQSTLSVQPATLTITAKPEVVTYGAGGLPTSLNNPTEYTVTGLVGSDTQNQVLNLTNLLANAYTDWATAGVNSHVSLSPYTIHLGGATITSGTTSNSLYSGMSFTDLYSPTIVYNTGTVTVKPAALTITTQNVLMPQGGTAPNLQAYGIGWTASGWSQSPPSNNDSSASLTTQPTITAYDASNNPVTINSSTPAGTYYLKASGAVDSDYLITNVNTGVLTVAASSAINNVGYQPDPLAPGEYILYVYGTAPAGLVTGNDTIAIHNGTGGGATGPVQVVLDGLTIMNGASNQWGDATHPISRIVVHGMGGTDTIGVDQNVTVPAWLYLDNGHGGSISGGGGPTYEFGDPGATLYGGLGRSILIGGAGSQTLVGGAGQAILIGGNCTYYTPSAPTDTSHDAALAAIMSEWNSGDSFATRMTDISGGSSTGLNGTNWLKSRVTVTNDFITDRLVLSTAAQDAFFFSLGDVYSPNPFPSGDQRILV